MHYVGISTYKFIPHYASAIQKQTHTPILKPSEDSEPTGLKADIANVPTGPVIMETRTTDCGASSGSDREHVVLNELLGIFKTLVQPQRVG